VPGPLDAVVRAAVLAGCVRSRAAPCKPGVIQPNKVLAAEYQTVLPDEAMIVQELERTTAELDRRIAAS